MTYALCLLYCFIPELIEEFHTVHAVCICATCCWFSYRHTVNLTHTHTLMLKNNICRV